MKSLRIAAYILIAIHFLRETRRKLFPHTDGKGTKKIFDVYPWDRPNAVIATCDNRDIAWRIADSVSSIELPFVAAAISPCHPHARLVEGNNVYIHFHTVYFIKNGNFSGLPLPKENFLQAVNDAVYGTRCNWG